MRKIILFCTCFFALNASAQMVELLGNVGIQGSMARQGMQSVSGGLQTLKNTQLLSAIQQTAMEIKTSYLNGYQAVHKKSILHDGRFQNTQWNVGPVGRNQFYIELSGLNVDICRYLVRSVRYAKSIEVNGQKGGSNSCTQNSKIKFVFD
ncbi:MAG: hypothetical protein IKY98_04530 [Alphaproteobacteria bacterium]|nr:hypothetical protein [Alphaproteobacteria bacterium]